jgi:glycosyltransferase involved in cell wall biosynthesis
MTTRVKDTRDSRTNEPAGEGLRVAYITQWFPPGPVGMPLWIAESLKRQGFHVRVLTGIPILPTGEVQVGFSAWRRFSETNGDFNVLRVPLYPSHDQSAAGRVGNYLTYAISSTVLGRSVLRSANVALVYSSPATAATAAMLSRIPYVLLIEDLWPDSVFASGFLTRGVARHLAETSLTWFTKHAYRRASRIAVTSPGMRDLLVRRGVPAGKVSLVYNWVDEQILHPTQPDPTVRQRLNLTDEFVVMYAGNHGPAQALEVPIRAMHELRDLPDVRLVLVGDGIQKTALRTLVEDLHLRSILFLDRIEPERMPAAMASAQLQLVSLADRDLFRITTPTKVQSILACGQPILSCAAGDVQRIVDDAGAGFTSPPGDPIKLARAIRHAYETPRDRLRDMGNAGYRYYSSTMSEAVSAPALASLLRQAAKAREA